MLCWEYSGLHHAPLFPLDTLAQLPRITDEHAFVSFSHLKPSVVIVTTPSSPASSSSSVLSPPPPVLKKTTGLPPKPKPLHSSHLHSACHRLQASFSLRVFRGLAIATPQLNPHHECPPIAKVRFFTNPAVSLRHCMLMRFANRRHC